MKKFNLLNRLNSDNTRLQFIFWQLHTRQYSSITRCITVLSDRQCGPLLLNFSWCSQADHTYKCTCTRAPACTMYYVAFSIIADFSAAGINWLEVWMKNWGMSHGVGLTFVIFRVLPSSASVCSFKIIIWWRIIGCPTKKAFHISYVSKSYHNINYY